MTEYESGFADARGEKAKPYPSKLKMYICVRDEVPDHMVPVLVAHSVLGAHTLFTLPENWVITYYRDWYLSSFKKVVLRINQKEWSNIRNDPDTYTYEGHENTVLGGEKSCLVVCPDYWYPNTIKFAKMWSPKNG